MNRLTKELYKRGILFETDELDIVLHGTIDACAQLVCVTSEFIVTSVHSEVLDPYFQIYDRNFNLLAQQDVRKDDNPPFLGNYFNPWSSLFYES